MKRFALTGLASLLTAIISLPSAAAGHLKVTLTDDLRSQRPVLEATVQKAHDRLTRVAKANGWERHVGPGSIREVQVFGSKDAFDKAALAASGSPAGTTMPLTFVGGVFDRRMLAVSPQVYAQIHGEDKDPAAWEKLLTHEMAHQLHIDVLNGREDRMGPIWFYEGFATVVADQYVDDLPTLSREDRQHTLFELRQRASYKGYAALVRYYLKGATLAELVRHAGEKDFLAWIEATYHDKPVPAPTPANIFHRSR